MQNTSQSSLFVSTGSLTAEVMITGSDAFIDTCISHPFWEEFIPSVRLRRSVDHQPVITWTLCESSQPRYDLNNRHIETPVEYIMWAIVIIEAVFEQLRQADDSYTLHGSVAALHDSAVGFIGGVSGLGKTSISTYIAAHGGQWLSDEKFVVDSQGIITAGVGRILNDDKTRHSSRNGRPDGVTAPVPLRLLCIPILTSESEPTVHLLDERRSTWQFYDEMSRDIRQINGMLQGFSEPLPSLDTPEIALRRGTAAASLGRHIHVAYIRGTASSITKEIQRLLSES